MNHIQEDQIFPRLERFLGSNERTGWMNAWFQPRLFHLRWSLKEARIAFASERLGWAAPQRNMMKGKDLDTS